MARFRSVAKVAKTLRSAKRRRIETAPSSQSASSLNISESSTCAFYVPEYFLKQLEDDFNDLYFNTSSIGPFYPDPAIQTYVLIY